MKLILFFKKMILVLLKLSFTTGGIILLWFLIYGGLWEWTKYKLVESSFNSEKWQMAGTKSDKYGHVPLERRCGMYRDLIKSHLKQGMRIEEVEDLLGTKNTWIMCPEKKIVCLEYDMGRCPDALPMFLFACLNKEDELVTYNGQEPCMTGKPEVIVLKPESGFVGDEELIRDPTKTKHLQDFYPSFDVFVKTQKEYLDKKDNKYKERLDKAPNGKYKNVIFLGSSFGFILLVTLFLF